MAHSDKNIVITPSIGSTSTDPRIVFSGADATLGPQNITLRAYPTSSGTLSFEGSAGQLFSITNSLTGTIFSVNDVSGIPSIEVLDDGTVKIAEYNGAVTIGGTSGTGAITLGRSTVSQTVNISNGATASGSTKTLNIGTGGLTGSTTTMTIGSANGTTVAANGAWTFSNDAVFTGNLTVNGTTSTINSTTISVDDKNIELGSVASPTDVTADGGGITLKGATDKTIIWGATNGWTSSEDLNVASGKIYRINGTSVLSATTLGSGVTASSLTSVGTITSGTWSGSFGAVSGANLTTLNASNLSSGTVATARLGTGTANNTTWLRGDGTWTTAFGASGVAGATGSQGIQGASGATGTAGTNGATGTAGTNGATGISGSTGPQGIQGASGATGTAGTNGATGISGTTGPQGIQGASGSTGIGYIALTSTSSLLIGTGSKAFTTTVAATASAFAAGQRVRASNTGTPANFMEGVIASFTSTTLTITVDLIGGSGTLAAWTITAAGNAGATGSTGPQGIQGASGATGTAGTNGASGITGASGVQGASGATGTAGINGTTGPQGIQGASGATGTAGINGASGIRGASGVQGASGSTGPQGIQGASGSTGPQGIQGASGATGTAGINGSTGPIGSTGPAGAGSSWSRKTANYTAVTGDAIIADTSGGVFTITLPATPATGNSVQFADGADWSVNNLTVARNGSTIEGSAANFDLDIKGITVTFLYDGTTWEVFASVGPSNGSVTNDTTTNASYYPTMSNVTSGSPTASYVSNTKLYFNPSTGTLNSTEFNSLSDITFKENIFSLSNAVDVVNKLNGVEFTWKDNGKKSFGVIAQELEQILPELINDSDGKKSVNYSGIIAFLINAIKEQQIQINTIKEVLNDNIK
jgi:hypothetical protein